MHDETDGRNRRLLVIDDNAAIHDDFRKVLGGETVPDESDELDEAAAALFGTEREHQTELVYEIDSAYQGQEGVGKVIESLRDGRPYALAFVDMRMPPGWDGIETIKRLWREDRNLQVVICTAYSDYTWSKMVDQLGSSDQLLILKKPFDNSEIRQLAAALTEKYHLAGQARLRMDELERMVDERTRSLEKANGELQKEIVERIRAQEAAAEKDKQLKEAQKLKAIGQLAGGIAHEFRNLLQAMRGYTQFAMEDLSPEDQRHQDLQQVIRAGDRAEQLTRQLLGFSRRQTLRYEHVEPNEVVLELEKMLRPVIGANIALDLRLGDDVGTIRADFAELQQVLLNLCINSRDAMPSGGRLVIKTEDVFLNHQDLETAQAAGAGRHGLISVADTGTGMPPEIMEQIFEPFFTTKEVGQGTGLGLSTAYGIIQQHKGAIRVRSEPGQGTTFEIFLPLVVESEQEPAEDGCGMAETPFNSPRSSQMATMTVAH